MNNFNLTEKVDVMYEICEYISPRDIMNVYIAYNKSMPPIRIKQIISRMEEYRRRSDARYNIITTVRCIVCDHELKRTKNNIYNSDDLEEEYCKQCCAGWYHGNIRPWATHQNGKRPYHVYIDKDKARVHIYNDVYIGTYDSSRKLNFQYDYLKTYEDVVQVFLGESRNDYTHKYVDKGNTILVELAEKYVYIGHEI